MTITPEQSQAIKAIDEVIEQVVALGDCKSGREIVSLLEKAKTTLVWGDFPSNKGESND